MKIEWTRGLRGPEDREGVGTERERRASGREDREGVENGWSWRQRVRIPRELGDREGLETGWA